MASVRNAPLESRDADVRQDHAPEGRPPRRAEVARRLGQRVHVDRAEARVEREVDVREGEDHVGADEEQVGLAQEPERGVERVLEELQQPDDEDDRRHDERHEREEADHGAQARQLQVHPVDGRHEEDEPDRDRLQREPERDLDRRPELRVVQDHAVGGEAAALPGLRVLQAEEQGRDQRDEEVDRAEHEPDEGGGGDVRPSQLHFAHRDARRWSGM